MLVFKLLVSSNTVYLVSWVFLFHPLRMKRRGIHTRTTAVLHVNNLSDNRSNAVFIFYADDTVIYSLAPSVVETL